MRLADDLQKNIDSRAGEKRTVLSKEPPLRISSHVAVELVAAVELMEGRVWAARNYHPANVAGDLARILAPRDAL